MGIGAVVAPPGTVGLMLTGVKLARGVSVRRAMLPPMPDSATSERCACPDEHDTADGRCAEPSIRSGDPDDPKLARYTWCGCCMADCPDVHGPEGRLPAHYHYRTEWSIDDDEFVGLATEFPSLSFLAPTPHEALAGIRSLVAEVLRDMAQTGETPPVPAPEG